MMCRVFGFKFVLLQSLIVVGCLLLDGTIAQGTKAGIEPRIVGGSPTVISQVPYLAQLHVDNRMSCGATIVSASTVVTAAHCVKGLAPKRVSIVAGASRLNQKGIGRRVTRIAIPRNFNRKNLNMDVAVLTLASPLPLNGNTIRSLPLCNTNWQPGARVRVSGWGLTSERSNSLSNEVRTAQLSVLKKTVCAQRYRSKTRLTRSMFCAARSGKDSCSGDSGGTVEFKNQFCGIVSWGIGCGRSIYPGVYTNVNNARVKKFIKRNMV